MKIMFIKVNHRFVSSNSNTYQRRNLVLIVVAEYNLQRVVTYLENLRIDGPT